jgi:integrase
MALLPAESLLADVCEKRYFLLNTKIRNEHTRTQYRIALRNLSDALGAPPKLEDLCDDSVALMMRGLLDKGLATPTINGRRDCIHSLWTWLAKRGHVAVWPTTPALDEPQRTPRAWSEKQLRALFNAAALERGTKRGIPKWQWWTLLLSLLWDTSERIGAILECRWEHVDFDSRWLHVPAECRKGRKKDMAYLLSPETVAELRMMRRRSPEFLLPPIYNYAYLWQAYERLLKTAGLPVDRKSKFHRIRRSVASHFEAAGGDAQRMMGHSSRAITEGYIDPSICVPPQATQRLARPDRWIEPSERQKRNVDEGGYGAVG